MQTAKEREAEFRKDLEELLIKHRATMEIISLGEYECTQGYIEVTMHSVRDNNGELVKEFSEFNL